MNNRILIILSLFITHTSFSQKLSVEAVYYDTTGTPFKIERKYTDKNNLTYITHYNQSSVCVKRQTFNSGDTTIIKETYYSIFNKRTKIDELQGCNNWMYSSNSAGDTVWIEGYEWDILGEKRILVGDTILTGDAAKDSWDFPERIKKVRVPSILDGKTVVNTDSLILNETVLEYFINGIPVKVEVFDGKNNKLITTTSERFKNKIIYKRYFTEDGLKPYEVDTVSWNKDTTNIRRSSTRFEWKRTSVSKFKITGTSLQVTFNDTTKREIEYLDDCNIFRNILIADVIYSDVYYYMELRHFDREKIVSETSNGQVSKNIYTFDRHNRIVEQLVYDEGQLQERVTYKYED